MLESELIIYQLSRLRIVTTLVGLPVDERDDSRDDHCGKRKVVLTCISSHEHGGNKAMSSIRKAERQDLPRIVELYEELTEEKLSVSQDTVNRVFDEIEAMPNQEFLVAEKDGFVVGTLFVQITPNLSHGARPWAILENMIVDSRYRRQGIGRQLVESALERCREAGCYKIQLLSNKKRREAHQFYRTIGFEDSALGFRLYF